jgi:dihydroxyacid dehydratase/phosphogluconate dehydratase
MTPEAIRDGGLLYLQTGDLLHLGLRSGQLNLADPDAFQEGRLEPADFERVRDHRRALADERLAALRQRQKMIAASNRMEDHTDAAHGVVPTIVFNEANCDVECA